MEVATAKYKNHSPTWFYPILRWWATWLPSRPQLMCDGNIVPYFGWRVRAHPRMELKLIHPPVRSTCDNVKHPQHIYMFVVVISRCSPRMVAVLCHHLKHVMVWFVATNTCILDALEAYTRLWFMMTIHIEGGWCIMSVFIGNTNAQIACNIFCATTIWCGVQV